MKNEINIAPFKYLINQIDDTEKFVLYKKWRFFASYFESFSWVYGISEQEIRDFYNIYINTKQEINNTIEIIENSKLKAKLKNEYSLLPSFDLKEYIIENNSSFIFIKILYPFKSITKTSKFNNTIKDIKLTTERMINYIENSEWLELEME